MSAFNLSGKEIIRFLFQHYDFVRIAFNVGKPDFILHADELQSLIAAHNDTATGSEISLSRLRDLKFYRQLPNGDYQLNVAYTSFLQFLFDDFVLSLPETIKRRYESITQHFENLQVERDEERTLRLIQEIVREMDAFLADVDGQTIRLLKDTESLKRAGGWGTDLAARIQKASYWITEYIGPLNNILDRNHPGSVMAAIIQVQYFAGERRLLTDSQKMEAGYQKLYGSALAAKTELDGTLRKLTRELLPLLDRIKSDSQILSGFYHFVENIDHPDNYRIPLPALLRKSRHTVVNKAFAAEAAFYLEHFEGTPTDEIFIETPPDLEWTPDTQHIKKLLIAAKDVPDYYRWCYDVLAKHTPTPTISNYFAIASLILENEFVADYGGDEWSEIQLRDAIVTTPKVRLYENLSARA